MFDVVELEELHRKAAGDDLTLASDAELLGAVATMERARATFDAAGLHLFAELEARGVCDKEFGLNTASWVAQQTYGDRRVAKTRVVVGHKLRRLLPEVDRALSQGEITFEHAKALADAANPRVEPEVAAEQAEWISKAADRPFAVWQQELRWHAAELDQDGAFDPNRELARNRMKFTPFGPEDYGVTGELVGIDAVATVQAIQAEADRLFRQFTRDHKVCPDIEVPPRATLEALAFCNLVRRGAGIDLHSTRGPLPDITVVLRLDGEVVTPDGTPVRAERYPHLFCDPVLHPVTFDDAGIPLHLGRSQRLASPGQRRMIAIRDGGCTFDGCDVPPSWCDIHHVEEWDHGGPTDIEVLAMECRHHHMVTHRPGWTMTATDDQHFIWTSPSGHVIHSQRHLGRPPPDSERTAA